MDLPDREMNNLEARLAGWQPAAIGPDRDRTLYLAGRAAARKDGALRLAIASTACLSLMVATLGGLLIREHGRRRAVEVALAEVTRPPSMPNPLPSPAATPGEISADSYLALTRRPLDFDTPRDVVVRSPSGDVPPASTTLHVGDRSRLTGL